MHRPPHDHRPYASSSGAGDYSQHNNFPPNPNINPQHHPQSPFQNPNPSFLNPFPRPQFRNPSFPNPSIQAAPAPLPPQNLAPRPQVQNPSSQNPRASLERVDSAVQQAQRDLIVAGENVSAWKASQAALVLLQVDSWGPLGFQLEDVPSLKRLLITEGKVNAFIYCFVGAQSITSLYDLEVAICRNEGLEQFEELGLGPLSRHPLVLHYFSIPSDMVEILKISSEDIIISLRSLMVKHDMKEVQPEEFLDFLAEQKSVSGKEKLGVRIQNFGFYITCIREAEKAERAVLAKSLEYIIRDKEESNSTGLPLSAHMNVDSTSGRVKLFSSSGNDFGWEHTRDGSSSTSEEIKRLGVINDMGENLNPNKDDPMGIDGYFGNKRKRKCRENNDNIMSKFMMNGDININKKVDTDILFDGKTEKFITTWKEACQECSASEVLDLMIDFYLHSVTEKRKARARRALLSYPGAGLLDVAVISIKHGLLEDYCFTPCPGSLEIGPSEKEDTLSNIDKDSDEHGCSIAERRQERLIRKARTKQEWAQKHLVGQFRGAWPMKKRQMVSTPQLRQLVCRFCRKTGHIQKECRRMNNQCLVCGSDDHMVGGCPKRTANREAQVPAAVVSQAPIVLARKPPLPSQKEAYRQVKKACKGPVHGLDHVDSQANEEADGASELVTGTTAVGDIIESIAKFFGEREVSTWKQSETLRKLSHCETWLLTQFSITDFSSLGHGSFFGFLEQHASLLPNNLQSLLNGGKLLPEKSCLQVSMLHQQLGLLLSQAQSNNLIDKDNISKSDISLVLRKQFPTINFHLVGNEEEKWCSDLVNMGEDSSNLSCVLYSVSLLGNHERLGHNHSQANSISKDALECLQKAPMLFDLLTWSHWDVVFAPALGPLSDWLLNTNANNVKELLCVATVDGKFIRVDHSATVDDFLEAMVQCSPFQVALKLLSLLSLYGGVACVPLSLLKCYVQRATNVVVRNMTNSMKELSNSSATLMHNLCGNNRAVAKDVARFVLNCLDYLPSEFRCFGLELLVSGLKSVAKDAYSVILHECGQTRQRLMLHEIGLSLGIAEWVDDFREFNLTAAALNINSLHAIRFGAVNYVEGNPDKLISVDHNTSTDNNRERGVISPNVLCEVQDVGAIRKNYVIVKESTVQDANFIVESIRREEFGLDPNLDYTESCMLKKQHARLGRALHCLSRELYSQDSHLLLELVQNADDNSYPEDVDPTLVFILQETGIVVLNNELGFSAQNIRALCDIGNSTKKGASAGYIGHKGIGFKSVFRVSDAPEIHSNGFHVKFDITEGQIGFVLPTVVPPCDINVFKLLLFGENYSSNDQQWNTCIVLPFRSKSTEATGIFSIQSMFSDLHPSLLLFLHQLKCIKFKNILNNSLVNMRKEILGNGIVRISHGQGTMTWLVVSKKLPASFIRPDVQSTEISVAFTLDDCENGEYKPHLSQQPVFSFLPLRNYGLKFILQGDFVLPSSREEVDGDSSWNQWLLSEFPSLFVSAEQSFCALPCFDKCPGKALTVYMRFVPVGGEVHGFFSRLPHMIISKLRTSNCLLLDGPNLTWVPPCRVLRGWNERARMLLPDRLLQEHLGLGYLRKDIELPDVLAKALGIQEYGPKVLVEFISSLCSSTVGIQSFGLDWLSSWLTALHSALSTYSSECEIIDYLKNIPFIPLSDGSYSSIANGPIWLPCDFSSGTEQKYCAKEFPSLYTDLRIVNPLLYNMKEARREDLVHMLYKLGAQRLSAHQVIKGHILPILSTGVYKDEHKYLPVEYLAFILVHFQYNCSECSSEKKGIMSELQKRAVLLTNHGYKCPIDKPIHFSKMYGNPVNIEKLTGSVVDDKWLEVDAAYLKHPSTRLMSSVLTKWREFFMDLGVSDFVHVTRIKQSALDVILNNISSRDIIQNEVFNVDDWESPELLEFLSTFSSRKCREECIYLLEIFDKMWDDSYSAYTNGYFFSETNENKRAMKSSFLRSLCDFKWVASSMDGDLHQSKELFYDCDEVRSVLGNLAPYAVPQVTSKVLLKDIGLKTQVSMGDALDILHYWRTSKAPFMASIFQMSKFYTFISSGVTRLDVKTKEEFTSSAFIFVPFLVTSNHDNIVSGLFLSPRELYWHDSTGCANKIRELLPLCASSSSLPCKTLATIYPGLCDFFVNVCGVPKSPSFDDYLQILLQLSLVALPAQAAHVVFRVFVKWADDVKRGSVGPDEILGLKEKLLKQENTVLPTLDDKWVSLHHSFDFICWPDDDELKQQFEHCDGLNFLYFGELGREDQETLCGRVATFMHHIGVPALSEVVCRDAISYGTKDNREKTALINWILPYAQRYLHKLYPDIYFSLKQLQPDKLSQLQVIVVDKLFYKNRLKGRMSTTSKRHFECSCLLQGNTLYVASVADPHCIFLELSRLFFDGSTNLQFANFLHMVMTMAESSSTGEQTESFISSSQKIPPLPVEEPLWSLSLLTEYPEVETLEPIVVSTDIDHNYLTSLVNKKESIPGTEDPPIPMEVENIGDDETIALHNSTMEESILSFPASEKSTKTHGGSQVHITGRLGEAITYKYFVEKLGYENVKWVNEESETGLPYDLIVTGVNGGSGAEYIEVKTTRFVSKDWFEISVKEWASAVELGDSYSIVRVMLGVKKASIIVMRDPVKLCQRNALQLCLCMTRKLSFRPIAL